MGCKFSFKRVFFVASLCFAGLFGISTISDNQPKEKEAKADETRTITITIDYSCGWNLNGNNWYTTQICFYNADVALSIYESNAENSGYDHSSRIGSPITLSPGDKDANNNRYASVTVPSNAVCFIVFGSWHNNRSYPQYIPTVDSGYDTFAITTNNEEELKKNYWQNGYWYDSSSDVVPSAYFDRKESTYSSATLDCDFYALGYAINDSNGECEVVNEYIYLNSETLSFSATCYGGSEYSDVVNVNNRASHFDMTSPSGSTTSIFGRNYHQLPTSNSSMLFSIASDSWNEDVPTRINIISDFRKTTQWNTSGSMDYTKININFKNSSGGDIIKDVALGTTTIGGVTYGVAQMPFGTETI